MVVEMRAYRTKPGTRAAFLEAFRSRSLPAHRALGIRILGPFLCVDDPDRFFFMRGFPDLEARERLRAEFYQSTTWKEELEPLLMPMLEHYDVVLVDDPEDLIRW